MQDPEFEQKWMQAFVESGFQEFMLGLSDRAEALIAPEIERRQNEGSLPNDFQVRMCLIKFPPGQPRIFQFDHEIEWLAEHTEFVPGTQVDTRMPVYVYDGEINRLRPPTVDGARVPFLFWDKSQKGGNVHFNVTLDPTGLFEPEEYLDAGDIARSLNERIIESSFEISSEMQNQLAQIGLWTATALIPNPLSSICVDVARGELDAARHKLVAHCTPEFIESLIETWKDTDPFEGRMRLFREAVFVHGAGMYGLAIYALIPQIEGIISDWLYARIYPDDAERPVKEKVRDFQVAINDALQSVPAYYVPVDFVAPFPGEGRLFPDLKSWLLAIDRGVLNSVAEFLLERQPFQGFRKWLLAIDPNFPGRHAVSHGKYDEVIFNEENSIKLFLLLDTICQFMILYELQNRPRSNPNGISIGG